MCGQDLPLTGTGKELRDPHGLRAGALHSRVLGRQSPGRRACGTGEGSGEKVLCSVLHKAEQGQRGWKQREDFPH